MIEPLERAAEDSALDEGTRDYSSELEEQIPLTAGIKSITEELGEAAGEINKLESHPNDIIAHRKMIATYTLVLDLSLTGGSFLWVYEIGDPDAVVGILFLITLVFGLELVKTSEQRHSG